ncbi:MAG: AzlC family ABC transporter permease [Glaciecola sp.]|nr:AzlC family ABC transporter permease [Glaciecola sp.]MDG1816173.1 AzlC family ABC transporter permease [Glaciecola sp.]MDG2098380.1 AzlC family ABC transporter permease [Glaciecola sp.]
MSVSKPSQHAFVEGMLIAFPLLLGFVPVAFMLGAEAAQKDFSSVLIMFLTMVNFAGGSEFAAIELWTSPPAVLFIIFVTLMVNSRHIIMGATLAPHIKHLPKRKILPTLFFMADEVWALAMQDITKQHKHTPSKKGFRFDFYLGVALPLYVTWSVCAGLGAYYGNMLGDLHQYGLHMAFPAMFIVILVGMWNGKHNALPWLVSALVAMLAYHYLPGGWYVILGTFSGIVVVYFQGDSNA